MTRYGFFPLRAMRNITDLSFASGCGSGGAAACSPRRQGRAAAADARGQGRGRPPPLAGTERVQRGGAGARRTPLPDQRALPRAGGARWGMALELRPARAAALSLLAAP